ncbi:MAG: tail fiber domain-containing protein [Acidobacteriota bacterium]
MTPAFRTLRYLALAACLVLVSLPMTAAPQNIEVEINSSYVLWIPQTEWKIAYLTVTGPDCINETTTFRGGEDIFFEIFDREGKRRPDGTYSLDVTLTPFIKERGGSQAGGGDAQLCRGRANLPELSTLTATGYVTIQNGKIADPRLEEDERLSAPAGNDGPIEIDLSSNPVAMAGSAIGEYDPDEVQSMHAADFLILDDLIVDGSACIGFDCVNGESFGFDTIRLKENNLRIKFDDTSVAASFPRTDWQLTANASANGGASKFSIDDISGGRTPFTVEANAPNHSLYVDDGGRIGLGTSTPVADLHAKSGDSPTLRLEQDGSSGFAPQTWDIAGNETNFFVRDASNGSQLPFRIRPGAPTNSIFVDVDGDLGLGTASPQGPLHIKDGSNDVMLVDVGNISASGTTLEVTSPDGSSGQFFSQALDSGLVVFGAQTNSNFAIRTNSTTDVIRITTVPRVGILNNGPAHPLHVGTDATNGNGAHVTTAGVWTNGSSRKNKTNIHDLALDEAMEALKVLQPVRYMGVNDVTEEEYLGFIAEDVPALVATNDRAGLASMDIVAVLTKVVQAQNKTIEELDKRLRELEGEPALP